MQRYFSPSENHADLRQHLRPQLSFHAEKVEEWRDALRKKLQALLGLPGIPSLELPAIEAQRVWVQHHELGSIEKIVFSSEPFSDIVAYFCVPRTLKPPYPAVICLQGHSTGMHVSIAAQLEDETQPLAVEGDRDFALGCLRHGFAALCIEQRSLGSRGEKVQPHRSPTSCHDAAMHALMLGRTLVGERVFDVDRGLDYLEGRGDIDMSRVGVMGNSGGGTTSIYSAALLDRIQFAMPSCSFCTYSDSIMSIHHCACNYVPGLLQWAEHADVLGLFAPKPLVVVAGKEDTIFPIEGVRKAFTDLQHIYEVVGSPENCVLVEGNGGHRFYEQEAWPRLLDLLGTTPTATSSRI